MTATARAEGLVGCRRCARVWPLDTPRCGLCGAGLESRDQGSLRRVWAWWVLGLVAYVPANLLPMLETRTLLSRSEDTILAGTIRLAAEGSWGIALVIFAASVLIPVGKFLAVGFLALSVRGGAGLAARHRHRLYGIVEYVGRWSMVDVFVVAILSALVQLNILASVKPGPAAAAFALSVICTMIAAQSFDSRLIWDRDQTPT